MKSECDVLKHVDLFWGNGAVEAPPGEGLAKHWNWLKAQTGNTHPGAVLPFGWVSALPYSGAYPTGYGRNGVSSNKKGPQVSDRDYAKGITHFHHSGVGYVGEFYNYVMVTPCSRNGNPARMAELTGQIAEPGYFAGCLKQYRVDFELTVTAFAALHRYKFQDDAGTVSVDFAHAGLDIPPAKGKDVMQSFHCERRENGIYSGFLLANGCRIYYAVRPEAEITDAFVCNGVMEFDISGRDAQFAVAFSLVSEEEAAERAIAASELGFDRVRKEAAAAWQDILGRVQVDFAKDSDRKLFYSTLYHSLVKPVDAGTEFTDFVTMWDAYRTQLPLMMLIAPDTAKRMLRSMLDTILKDGFFPCCKMLSIFWARHEVQSTALVVYTLADGFFRDLLTKEDYPELKKAFTLQFAHSDLEGKSLTHVLDLSGAFYAASQVAGMCGDTETASAWRKEAECWKKAYDPATGLLSADSKYYEGDHWNYSFRPHYQMAERVALAGGKEGYETLLDKFFGFGCTDTYSEVRPMIDNRFEGMNNESDMETPAAYLWCGRADKQADIHNQIRRYMFLNGRGGCPGNNDSGALSSWYVLSCLGLYPLTGTQYCLLTSPSVDSAGIDLGGKKLAIEVIRESAEAIYPAGYDFNGRAFAEPYIKLEELCSGGVLKFRLADQPQNKSVIPDWL